MCAAERVPRVHAAWLHLLPCDATPAGGDSAGASACSHVRASEQRLPSVLETGAGADTADDSVKPGTTYTYTWHVSAPADDDQAVPVRHLRFKPRWLAGPRSAPPAPHSVRIPHLRHSSHLLPELAAMVRANRRWPRGLRPQPPGLLHSIPLKSVFTTLCLASPQVPESSGPGPQDPSTILWMYHSHNGEWQGCCRVPIPLQTLGMLRGLQRPCSGCARRPC